MRNMFILRSCFHFEEGRMGYNRAMMLRNGLLSYLLVMTIIAKLYGCGKVKGEKEGLIDISNLLSDKTEFITLRDIAKSVRYIPLEVCENSMFRIIPDLNERKTQVIDSMIFVTDGQNLVSFNLEGKFLTKYGCPGRGPREYINIDNYSVSNISKKVYIHCAARSKVLSFSLEGSFLNETSINIVPNDLVAFNDKFVCVSCRGWRELDADGYAISILNKNGSLFRRFIDRGGDTKRMDISVPAPYDINAAGDKLFIFEHDYSLLYAINKEFKLEKTRAITLYNGKQQEIQWLNHNKALRNYNFTEAIRIDYSLITERNLFFRISNRGERQYIVYDLADRKGYLYQARNNLDEGPNFWPTGATHDGVLYQLVSGKMLLRIIGMENVDFKPSGWLNSSMKGPDFKDSYVLMLIYPK